MADKLTLIVHGIGEQAPGESVKDFAFSAINTGACQIESNEELIVDNASSTETQLKKFPCHTIKATNDHTHVFAEVYWADLSPGGHSNLTTLIDVFKTILGMGYLAIANAKDWVVPDTGKTPFVKPTLLALRLLHGPIAVISFMLITEKFLYWLAYHFLNITKLSPISDSNLPDMLAMVLTAGVCFLFCFWYFKVRQEKNGLLFSIFAKGMLAYGIFILLYVAFAMVFPDALPSRGADCIKSEACTSFWFFELNILILSLSWLAVSVIAFWLSFSAALLRATNSKARKTLSPPLFPSICIFVLAMFMVLISTSWIGFEQGLTQLPGWKWNFLELTKTAQLPIIVCWAFILVLMTMAAIIWGLRRAKAETPDIPRLILNDWLESLLLVGNLILTLALFLVILVSGAATFKLIDENSGIPDLLVQIDSGYQWTLSLAGFAIVLYLTFWRKVSAGFGILKDIIGYFAYAKGPDGQPDFFNKAKIDARFQTVLKVMLERENPDELIIVSHSQGTVIAIDNLGSKEVTDKIHKGLSVSLITMGSPISHIYQHYFPNAFNLREKAQNLKDKNISWLNIYRRDDFVGRMIPDTQCKSSLTALADLNPKNENVGPRGHTGYWSDKEVHACLQTSTTNGT